MRSRVLRDLRGVLNDEKVETAMAAAGDEDMRIPTIEGYIRRNKIDKDSIKEVIDDVVREDKKNRRSCRRKNRAQDSLPLFG